jgi:hypothetical protein
MSDRETFDVEFFEDFFDYNDYDRDDIKIYITENYQDDLHKLGLILLRGANEQDVYKDCVAFFREELKGLIEYAKKHNIELP